MLLALGALLVIIAALVFVAVAGALALAMATETALMISTDIVGRPRWIGVALGLACAATACLSCAPGQPP